MAVDGRLITIEDDRWKSVLDRVPHDVYDTVPYVLAEADRIGARATAFVVEESDRVFAIPLLVRLVPGLVCEAREDETFDAVSPYGYPGVLLSRSASETSGFAAACLTSMRAVLRDQGICSAFVRMSPVLNDGLAELLNDDALVVSGTTVSIDLLQSPEDLWASMRKGHTNAINKAKRFGFQVSIGPAENRFEDFLVVYAETLERLQAAPHYHLPTEYLRSLMAMPNSFVALATLDNDIAGAYCFFECGGIIQMHLGGPLGAYMRPSSSNLLIHEVALWGMARGDRILHLGGGVGGSASDTLFTFKSGFSPRRHPFCTIRVIADHGAYQRMLQRKAGSSGTSVAALLASGYFPAYRSNVEAT